MVTIYVGNLPDDISDADLEMLFTNYGSVSYAKVIIDKNTGRSRGFGFVEMKDETQAQNAINTLNDIEFQKRKIRVSKVLEDPRF